MDLYTSPFSILMKTEKFDGSICTIKVKKLNMRSEYSLSNRLRTIRFKRVPFTRDRVSHKFVKSFKFCPPGVCLQKKIEIFIFFGFKKKNMWKQSNFPLPSVLIVESGKGDVFIVENKSTESQVEKILKKENSKKSLRCKLEVKLESREPSPVTVK